MANYKRTRDEMVTHRRTVANKNKLRIVQLQLKSIIPLMEARMDTDTAEEISATLTEASVAIAGVAKDMQQLAARLHKPSKPKMETV